MRYPAPRYINKGDSLTLRLHTFEGLSRLVNFSSGGHATQALRSGRAELDCVAILQGFLPVGAVSVIAAQMPTDAAIADLYERYGSTADPLAIIRIRHSLHLLVSRSRAISEASDADARLGNVEAARRYDRIAADLS